MVASRAKTQCRTIPQNAAQCRTMPVRRRGEEPSRWRPIRSRGGPGQERCKHCAVGERLAGARAEMRARLNQARVISFSFLCLPPPTPHPPLCSQCTLLDACLVEIATAQRSNGNKSVESDVTWMLYVRMGCTHGMRNERGTPAPVEYDISTNTRGKSSTEAEEQEDGHVQSILCRHTLSTYSVEEVTKKCERIRNHACHGKTTPEFRHWESD